jgi:hypothetical protein
MWQLSNVISDAVLAVVGLGVYFTYFSRVPLYNRLLWGVFLVTISMAAGVGACRFAGVGWLVPLHVSLQNVASSVGIMSVVVAVWALINSSVVSHQVWLTTLSVGFGVFTLLTFTALSGFTLVVQSLGMLATMLIAVYGLARGYRKATWIIAGIMIVGIATKMPAQSFFNATDLYHYSLALTLVCFGKSV